MLEAGSSNLRKFLAPEIVFGVGALDLAGRYARNFRARRVFVVSDMGVTEAGWTSKVLESLTQAEVDWELFTEVTPNPKDREVTAGVEAYDQAGCDVILAVGGGSPMDCAKGIGVAATNKRNVLEFEGVDEVDLPGPPLICIPTTAGTSADVSQFGIITDTERQVKITIISKLMIPDVSLIDPQTTITMSKELTACTGMDALAHAVEAYVSKAHSALADLHALRAVDLITENLLPAVQDRRSLELKTEMMLASLHAGLAFSNVSLGATHAMAHSLGGVFDLPHGRCNALLLEHVVAFNYPSCPERYQRIGRAMGIDMEAVPPEEGGIRVARELKQLRERVGLGPTFEGLDLPKSLVSKLADNALADPCMRTNPREPDRRDIEVIYEQTV